MNLWWTEDQTAGLRLGLRCRRVVSTAASPYQEVAVLDSVQFGRVLTLDDMVMTTEGDEFVYHEMLVHPAMVTADAPRRVLIVGGGDGGAVREVLRHPSVTSVVLAELDEEVVRTCRRELPAIAGALGDPRVTLAFGDGARYLAESADGAFDVILVDAPDPIGPAEVLFSSEFYAHAARVLAPGGALCAQTESPFLHADFIRRVQADLARAFPVVRLCWAVVPTYPGSMWTFSLASHGRDPLRHAVAPVASLRYWSPEVHRAAFVLPPFVAELLPQGSAL